MDVISAVNVIILCELLLIKLCYSSDKKWVGDTMKQYTAGYIGNIKLHIMAKHLYVCSVVQS